MITFMFLGTLALMKCYVLELSFMRLPRLTRRYHDSYDSNGNICAQLIPTWDSVPHIGQSPPGLLEEQLGVTATTCLSFVLLIMFPFWIKQYILLQGGSQMLLGRWVNFLYVLPISAN